MTLFDAYLYGNHRVVNKWQNYFPVYEKHFERFRNRHVTLFEIGIGQGGSLQLWKGFLGPFARIVGLDVYPPCKQCEEDQVSVRIGRQDDLAFLAEVVAEFGPPDIVIDDGSHLQPDIKATFDFLYPLVAKNGVYLVEDLHAAYWPEHGGGYGVEGSFIEIAKDCVDALHAEHSVGVVPRSALGDRTTSIHFYDSVVVLEVGEHRPKVNRTTGDPALFRDDWVPPGETPESFARIIREAVAPLRTAGPDLVAPIPDGRLPRARVEALAPQLAGKIAELSAAARYITDLQDRIRALETELSERGPRGHASELENRVRALEAEISAVRGSTSWRIGEPFRALGRIFKA